jgi:hypothetical protein
MECAYFDATRHAAKRKKVEASQQRCPRRLITEGSSDLIDGLLKNQACVFLENMTGFGSCEHSMHRPYS